MDNQTFEKAQKKVRKIKKFYNDLAVWLAFSIFFVILNALTSNYPWSLFPIIGWGIGILVQAIEVFGVPGLSKDWERRKMEEELQKLEMEDKLRSRYLELKQKEDNNILDESEELDLEELRKIKKTWEDSDLV
jgi:hypothetical protein